MQILAFIENNIWPIVLIIFLCTQKAAVGALLSKLKSISINQIGFTTESIEPQPKSDDDKQKQVIRHLQDKLTNSPVLLQKEKEIIAAFEEEGLEVNSDAEKFLIKRLAAVNILHNFESIYNFIYGSQISFLKKINESDGLPAQELEEYHLKTSILEDKGVTADAYYGFLYDRQLIQEMEQKGESVVYITGLGREFLIWLVQYRKKENKES